MAPGSLTTRALLRSLWFVAVAAAIFLLAGRLDYWQGWVYAGLNQLLLAANLLIMRRNPGLMAERLSPGEGMKGWDKVYFAVSTPLYFLTLGLSALDAGRFGWSPALPAWAYGAALALYCAGQILFLWAKATNDYFATVVRIQSERGQRVCDRGPYRLVRHPGYVGGVLFELATPLLLGSLWGVIPQGVAAAALVVRTALEDHTLQRELPGYREYAARVPFRLLPYLW